MKHTDLAKHMGFLEKGGDPSHEHTHMHGNHDRQLEHAHNHTHKGG